MTAAARYALRIETNDGTLEDPFHHVARKDWAISFAKEAAKNCSDPEAARVHVDDTRTDQGIFNVEVKA